MKSRAEKLLALVGANREKHSSDEVSEAEAELAALASRVPVSLGFLCSLFGALLTLYLVVAFLMPSYGIRRAAWSALGLFGVRDSSSLAFFIGRKSDVDDEAYERTMRSLRLRPTASRAEAAEFVGQVLAKVSRRSCYSADDPAVYSLASIGHHNLDLLLVSVGAPEPTVNAAINALAQDSDKSRVVNALRVNPNLAALIRSRGWQSEAKEILIGAMRQRSHCYPVEWVDAVVDLADPGSYEDLLAYLQSGINQEWTYRSISRLRDPRILTRANAIWKSRQNGNP